MIILTPDDLFRCDLAAVEAIASRRGAAMAFGRGELRGYAAAAALNCDWLALDDTAAIIIDTPAAWSAAIWRIGGRALRLHLAGRTQLTAADSAGEGLCDEIVAAGADPLKWVAGWIGGRSTVALDSAAALIRSRGGDVLERSEFARLFAVGEPQTGLTAFLTRSKPQWRNRDEG